MFIFWTYCCLHRKTPLCLIFLLARAYYIRDTINVAIPHHSTTYFQSQFKHKTSQLYNSLPLSLRIEQDHNIFIKKKMNTMLWKNCFYNQHLCYFWLIVIIIYIYCMVHLKCKFPLTVPFAWLAWFKHCIFLILRLNKWLWLTLKYALSLISIRVHK